MRRKRAFHRAAVVIALAVAASGAWIEAAEPGVTLYYLHATQRCRTCLSIEAQAESVVRGAFAAEVKAGALAFRSVDFQTKGNEHFVADFGLVASSLVLVEMKDGRTVRSKVLQDAWTHVRDEGRFQAWLKDEVVRFLEGKS